MAAAPAGSQLPLSMPRSDARQNLIDSLTCATSFFAPPHTQLQEVAICFGGRLMRGNRAQKVRPFSAFVVNSVGGSPAYHHASECPRSVSTEGNSRSKSASSSGI